MNKYMARFGEAQEVAEGRFAAARELVDALRVDLSDLGIKLGNVQIKSQSPNVVEQKRWELQYLLWQEGIAKGEG